MSEPSDKYGFGRVAEAIATALIVVLLLCFACTGTAVKLVEAIKR